MFRSLPHLPIQRIHLIALICTLIAFTIGISPAHGQAVVVTKQFQYIRQGQVGVITITGGNLAGAVAQLFDRTYPFFPITTGYAALISVDVRQKILKDYPITVTLYNANGSTSEWKDTINVASGEYISEKEFILPRNKVFLLNPQIQADEDARRKMIYDGVTPERYWEGSFIQPANGPYSSPFGAVRTYNDASTRRHTGMDITVPGSTPVLASAAGRVVFARAMDIHGNNVIIDHGWGVFSEYAHFSQLFVVPGQFVLQGDVIGLSGNTGRSTGPHLHWEIAVNGNAVNPLVFISMKLPY